jgi:TolB-like protein/Tfp pilus assembly protein PilF
MRRAWLLTSAGMLLIAAGLGWHLAQRPAAPQIRAIAVLPFVDMSEQHDQQYFADGMAEEIMDLLATVPALKVIGRTSSFSFRDNTSDLRRIGEQLGATYIVEGSVRRSGSRVRIGAQLVDSATGTSIWSGTMDREFHDVLALQQQIASEISRALQLAAGADFLHQERQPINAEAYNYYLRGRWAIDRGDDGVREAKTDFEQSLALDPTSVKATEGLALAYLEEVAGHLTASAVAWPAAEDAARRALALDPGSALAHALLGLGQVTYEYDWAGANQELDRALALHPHDPYALYIGAWLAFDLGRHKECIRLQEAALAIDPLNPDSLQNDAYIRYLLGDLKAAERGFKRSLEISPTYYSNHRMLGEILLKQGDPVAALAQMELEMTSGRDLGLALAYFANGRKQEADRALARVVQDLDQYGEVNVALAYAYRNERHEAFEWLQRAVASRDINLGHRLKYDWMFDTLRSDPRYHALLKQMHYPE